jgi:hypothetical protein
VKSIGWLVEGMLGWGETTDFIQLWSLRYDMDRERSIGFRATRRVSHSQFLVLFNINLDDRGSLDERARGEGPFFDLILSAETFYTADVTDKVTAKD